MWTASCAVLLALAVTACVGEGGADAAARDGGLAHLVPFVQVSDLHLSVYHPEREQRLREFLAALPGLAPSFVLVTGDLTDGIKPPSKTGSLTLRRGFVEAEWDKYAELAGPAAATVGWHDLRGNHDGYNSIGWRDVPSNRFITHSVRVNTTGEGGALAHRHYAVDHKDGAGRVIRVVAFDAVPDPAPTRHFFGALSTADLDELAALFAAEPVPAATVLMGHYPFNSLVAARSSAGESLQELMARHRVAASVSGHLHRFPKPLDAMYARHEGGTMELEVTDLGYNSAFRLAAFDDGVLSFTDTALGEWPAVLITSPVDARYGNPWNGPQLGAGRNRVRCVVWTEAPVASLHVSINGVQVGTFEDGAGTLSTSPLPWHGSAFQYSYFEHGSGQEPVLERVEVRGKAGFPAADLAAAGKPAGLSASVFWVDLSNEELASALRAQEDEKGLPGGTHSVSVTVVDVAGARRVVSQPFTVDGRVVDVPFPVAQWFMTRSFRDLLGGISTAISLVVVYGSLCGALAWEAAAARGLGVGGWVWGPYVALRHVYPAAFWALLGLGLYVPLGPWMVGPLVGDRWALFVGAGYLTAMPQGLHFVPNYDVDMNVAPFFLLALAPAVALWALAAHAALRAHETADTGQRAAGWCASGAMVRAEGSGEVRLLLPPADDKGGARHVSLAPAVCCLSPLLLGLPLLASIVFSFYVLVPVAFVYSGPLPVIFAVFPTWTLLLLAVSGVYVILGDAWRQGAWLCSRGRTGTTATAGNVRVAAHDA